MEVGTNQRRRARTFEDTKLAPRSNLRDPVHNRGVLIKSRGGGYARDRLKGSSPPSAASAFVRHSVGARRLTAATVGLPPPKIQIANSRTLTEYFVGLEQVRLSIPD